MFAGSRLLLPVHINCVTLVPKPGRKEGHVVREPSLLSGIAVLRRSGSRKWRRPPVAARSGGAGAKEEQVGRKTRCRAPGTRRGGCHPRGSGGVAAVRQWAGACCHHFICVFVYFIIKIVKCSPVPASFFPYISTALQRVYSFTLSTVY